MNWEQVLKGWAKEYRATLDERVQDLIGMAHCDLWYGPYSAGEYAEEDPSRTTQWPGFETACREIREGLEALPSRLWLADCGAWTEHEPALTESCPDCNGNDDECETCKGSGVIEAFVEFWVEVDRSRLLKEIAGKELAEYVR